MTSARVTFNELIDGGSEGIEVDGGSSNIIVFNSEISGVGAGVQLEGSPMAFLNCNNLRGIPGLEVVNDNAGATIPTQDHIGSRGTFGLTYGTGFNSFDNTGSQIREGNLFEPSAAT